MAPLTPIPTPLAVRWREFRATVVPVVVFISAFALAGWLWWHHSEGPGLPGIAEGRRSTVTAPRAGRLLGVPVEPYDPVGPGQTVAVLLPQDPRTQLGLLQTELDLARMRLEPTLAEGNAFDFERLRADLLEVRTDLAVAEVRLQRSESEFRRHEPLWREQLVSDDVLELVRKTRDADLAEVHARSNTVREIEQRLQALQPIGEPGAVAATDPGALLLSRMELLRDLAATNLAPLQLAAPIAGTVGSVLRQPGEDVVEGEPLVTVLATRADRVVAYLRQPYRFEPQAGHPARITTRERVRREFPSYIVQVGAQVEPITNALAYVPQGALVDVGLPVVLAVPEAVQIRPGEIVDVRLEPPSEPPPGGRLEDRRDEAPSRAPGSAAAVASSGGSR